MELTDFDKHPIVSSTQSFSSKWLIFALSKTITIYYNTVYFAVSLHLYPNNNYIDLPLQILSFCFLLLQQLYLTKVIGRGLQ